MLQGYWGKKEAAIEKLEYSLQRQTVLFPLGLSKWPVHLNQTLWARRDCLACAEPPLQYNYSLFYIYYNTEL